MAKRVGAIVLLLAVAVPVRAANLVQGAGGVFLRQHAYAEGGRTLVPLRGVAEWLGGTVEYRDGSISIQGAGTALALRLGARQAQVGERTVALDAPARALGGVTLVPLRFVAEALGAEVRFIAGAQNPFTWFPMVSLRQGDRAGLLIVHGSPPHVVDSLLNGKLDLEGFGSTMLYQVERGIDRYVLARQALREIDGDNWKSDDFALYRRARGGWTYVYSAVDMMYEEPSDADLARKAPMRVWRFYGVR